MKLYNLYTTISESQEIDEALPKYYSKGAKNLVKTGVGDKMAVGLAKIFNVNKDVVLRVMKTDKKKLESAIKSAINKDIKNNFIGGGHKLGKHTKQATTELSMKEILELGEEVGKTDIDNIIKRNKKQSRSLALSAETKVAQKTAQQTTQQTPTGPKPKPQVPPKTFQTLTQKLKGMLSNNILTKTYRLWKKLKMNWVIFFAIIAGGTIYSYDQIRKYLEDKELDDLDMMEAFAKCILILIDTMGAELIEVNGDPVVVVTATGDQRYDSKGGLVFYPNNVVTTGDKTQKGTWECNPEQSGVQVNERLKMVDIIMEQESNDISEVEMNKRVTSVSRSLNGWVSVKDLRRVRDVIVFLQDKTYKGENAISRLHSYYERLEKSKIIDDVESVGVRNLGVSGIDLKDEIISLLKKPQSRNTPTRNTPTSGLSGIKITWGSQEQPSRGQEQTGGQQSSNEPEYVNCETTGFPYKYGCVSSHIAKIQRCLGISPQKGYFGPKTLRVLRNIGHDLSNGLTKEIYDIEVRRCEGTPKPTENNTQQEPNAQQEPSTQAQFNSKESSFSNDDKLDESLEFYNMMSKNGLIVRDGKNTNRIKFKGAELSENQLAMLDTVLKLRGFNRLKNVEKGYGYKHVWQKRKRQ